MQQLRLQNIKRNYFDPQAKIAVPEGKLELWPGYLTSIRSYENDNILLCAEIIHKFMRNETVYEIARSLMSSPDWQDTLRKEIVGTTVLTDYTNKTYNVDDIDFTMTPRSTFLSSNGDETNFMEYYKNKYNIMINDDRQMMLVSRAKERDIRAGMPENIYLIPELSRATGLTDRLRSNFKLMQQISAHTRLSPEDRVKALHKFNRRIQTTEGSVKILRQWELELSRELVQFEARELAPEDIIFGSNHKETASQKAEWQIRGSTAMYSAVNCERWIFLYPRALEREAMNFLKVII
jgi:aubergine-like protein